MLILSAAEREKAKLAAEVLEAKEAARILQDQTNNEETDTSPGLNIQLFLIAHTL